MKLSMLLVSTALGASAIALANPAHAAAANAPAADTQAASESEGIGDIIVTARRTSESLQSVPVAVAAFNQAKLTEAAVATSFDVAKIVPGISVDSQSGNPSIPSFSIRGRGSNYGASSGSVETYFADVPLSSPFQMPQLPAQFFDLSSFQVLKGPQGTLFGRSTTGGAVLIVPQAPTDTLEGYVRVQGGSYGNFQAEGAINIPIVADKAALRIAAYHWSRDGYMHASATCPTSGLDSAACIAVHGGTLIHDSATGKLLGPQTYNNQNTNEIRATLKLNLAPGFENSTIVTYHEDKTRSGGGAGMGRIPGVYGVPGCAADFGGAGLSECVYQQAGFGTRTSYTDVNMSKPATKVWGVINTTSVDLTDVIKIKNIFGYIDARGYTNDGEDPDGTALAVIDVAVPPTQRVNKQLTDELQITGTALDRRLSYTLGGLIDRTREPGFAIGSGGVVSQNTNFASYITSTSLVAGSAYQYQMFARFQQNTIDSHALFGSLSFKPTDTINIGGGFRRTWDHVVANQYSALQPGGVGTAFFATNLGTAAAPVYSQMNELRSHGDVYNVDLDWHPTQRTMIYGGYRHGYKRGGFNASTFNPAEQSFDKEGVDDFHIGAKTDFELGGMRARFNVEGYIDKYKGMQVSYLSLEGGSTTTITTNVPKTTFKGIEADLTLEPAPWLTLFGSYALIDAKNTEWTDPTYAAAIQTEAFGAALHGCGCSVATLLGAADGGASYLVPATAYAKSVLGSAPADLTVNPVAFASKHKLFGSARFHGELPNNLGEVVVMPSASWQSKIYSSPFTYQLPAITQVIFGNFRQAPSGGSQVPAYATVDLRVEWNHINGSQISLGASVTNLTNKFYYLGNASTLQYGFESWTAGPPRMVAVEVSAKF